MTALAVTKSPVPMDHNERMRLRTAAIRVLRLYPGPVGQLISEELLTWEEFGFRLGAKGLIQGVVDHVLREPLPIMAPKSPAGRGAVGYGDRVMG